MTETKGNPGAAVKTVSILALFFMIVAGQAEQTVGLFLNDERASEGYTLFAPSTYTTTYLINIEGELINSWDSEYHPGMSAYLSDDGYLYRAIPAGTSSRFDGWGGGVEKLDWQGNMVWTFIYCNDDVRHHHDIELMPNGNILMIAWEHRSYSEAIAAGRDPATLHPAGMWTDHIVEIEPTGDSGNIVWEWHAWDHLVQDFDSAKDNYDDVSLNPGLINLNFNRYPGLLDWIHLNSITYREDFDQILISSRYFSEVWILDHSTTREEASGHTGGKYGRGGDILYRWGNPATYDQGTIQDQQFFRQHDAQWIPQGYLGEGNILVYNNGDVPDREFSTVDEIVPPVDTQGNYTIDNQTFDPEQPVWTYSFSSNTYSTFLSGAQRMPNGNTLICIGPDGVFSEVTPGGEEVWRYVNPVTYEGPLNQGEVPQEGTNAVFKVIRYPSDFPGFEGKDMTPKGPIELEGIADSQSLSPGLEFDLDPSVFNAYTSISYQLSDASHVYINIYDVTGRQVRTLVNETMPAGNYQVIWEGTDTQGNRLSNGVYFVSLKTDNAIACERTIIIK